VWPHVAGRLAAARAATGTGSPDCIATAGLGARRPDAGGAAVGAGQGPVSPTTEGALHCVGTSLDLGPPPGPRIAAVQASSRYSGAPWLRVKTPGLTRIYVSRYAARATGLSSWAGHWAGPAPAVGGDHLPGSWGRASPAASGGTDRPVAVNSTPPSCRWGTDRARGQHISQDSDARADRAETQTSPSPEPRAADCNRPLARQG
jgi:hypothetical protein